MSEEDSDWMLQFDKLTDQFIEQLRNNESPSITDYVRKYPEWSEEIRLIFPTLHTLHEIPASADSNTTTSTPKTNAGHPDRIGNYRILRLIGWGGMGVVYEAIQTSLNRRVALKILTRRSFHNREIERFRREAETASRLHHTNIVSVYEAGQEGDVFYFAMQYIHGCNLEQWISQVREQRSESSSKDETNSAPVSPPTPPDQDYPGYVARLGEQAASGLAYAHERGVIHRDIKPANLLLDANSTVWINDFGLVKTDDSDLTSTGALVGTLRYLAPERIQGQCYARSDVYSLGLTIYELLTLRPAFSENEKVGLLYAIQHREPPAPRKWAPTLPRELETIVLRAIQKDPGQRYRSASELAEDLRRFRNGEPILAARTGPLRRTWNWAHRHPTVAVLLTLVCVTLALLAGISLWTAQQAVHNADKMKGLVTQSRTAEQTAKRAESVAVSAEKKAKASEAQAQSEQRHANLLAARLRFSKALIHAREGDVDFALFEMVETLRTIPNGDDTQTFRHVVRLNLDAWSRQTATLNYAFRIPDANGPNSNSSPRNLHDTWVAPMGTKGSFLTFGKDRMIRKWSYADGSPSGHPFRLDLKNELPRAVSPSGTLLATTVPEIRIRDLATGKLLPHSFTHLNSQGMPVKANPAFTYDPNLLVTVGFDGKFRYLLRFRNISTGDAYPLVQRIHPEDVWEVYPDSAGKPMLLVNRHVPNSGIATRLDVWSIESGKPIHPQPRLAPPLQVPGASHWGNRLVFLPRGRFNSTLPWLRGTEGPVQLWDRQTGNMSARPVQLPRPSWYQQMVGDSSVLLVQQKNDTLQFFDLRTRTRLGARLFVPGTAGPFHRQNFARGLAISPDHSILITGGNNVIRGWRIDHLVKQGSTFHIRRPPLYPVKVGGNRATLTVALAPGGRFAFFARGDHGQIIDTKTRRPVSPILSHHNLNHAVFSSDGKRLITATIDSKTKAPPILRAWSLPDGTELYSHKLPHYIEEVVVSPDDRYLGVACVGAAFVYDLAEGTLCQKIPLTTTANTMCFSRNKDFLAVGCRDGWGGKRSGVGVWDLQTGKTVRSYYPFQHLNYTGPELHITGQGNRMFVLDQVGQRLLRFDLTRPKKVPTRFDINQPNQLVGATTSDIIAITNRSGVIEVWDAELARKQFSIFPRTSVQQLVWNEDGSFLAGLDLEQAIHLWSGPTGIPIGPTLLHSSPVRGLRFTSDNRELVTVTAAGRVYRWPLPEPIPDDLTTCKLRLSAKLGIEYREGELHLLSPEGWQILKQSRQEAKKPDSK